MIVKGAEASDTWEKLPTVEEAGFDRKANRRVAKVAMKNNPLGAMRMRGGPSPTVFVLSVTISSP